MDISKLTGYAVTGAAKAAASVAKVVAYVVSGPEIPGTGGRRRRSVKLGFLAPAPAPVIGGSGAIPAVFELGAGYASYFNPAAYSVASGEVPFNRYASGSLHYGGIGGNTLSALASAGQLRGDGSVVYGPVTDPSGNAQGGWMELGCKSTDADDHGTAVKRSEENWSELCDMGDEFWHCFVLRDYSDSTGLYNFGRRGPTDYDNCDVQFVHDNGFSGGLPGFLALTYTTTNTGVPVRTWRMTHAVWDGTTYTMGSAQHVYAWDGGTSVTLANGRAATVDPNYPGNVGERWKFMVHVRYGMTGGYCKVWGAPYGSAPALIVNNTTHPLGFDPTASGGSNTGAIYLKGPGMYQTSYPAGAWHFRTARRRAVALRNQHAPLLANGHTEASIVAAFNSFLEGA
jgi:hypothetical protein